MPGKFNIMAFLYAFMITMVVTWLMEVMIQDVIITSIGSGAMLMLFGYAFFLQAKFIHIDQLRSLSFYFMNQFILTLSVKTSIASTLTELYPSLHPRIRRALDDDEGLPAIDTLKRLNVLFDFPLYSIFLHMIDIHIHHGGSIIDMTDMLLSRARREEIEWNEKRLTTKKKLGQLMLLWFLNFLMIGFVRFGLSDIFIDVFPTLIFKLFILIFVVVFALSCFVFFYQAYGGHYRAIE